MITGGKKQLFQDAFSENQPHFASQKMYLA